MKLMRDIETLIRMVYTKFYRLSNKICKLQDIYIYIYIYICPSVKKKTIFSALCLGIGGWVCTKVAEEANAGLEMPLAVWAGQRSCGTLCVCTASDDCFA